MLKQKNKTPQENGLSLDAEIFLPIWEIDADTL